VTPTIDLTRAHVRESVLTNTDVFPRVPRTVVVDPFTAEAIGEVADCGGAEVDVLVRRARQAFVDGLPRAKRISLLESVAEGLRAAADNFAGILALETGKSLKDCRSEVARAQETLRYTIAEARTQSSRVIPADAAEAGEGALAMEMRVPRGVLGAITPFNFPLNTAMHKVAPAIAVGCPVILKPAHQTPLTALLLQRAFREAGLPEEWLQVVTDSAGQAGAALVAHPDVAVISFTGSNRVGWSIAQAAVKKKVLLELGSNAPVIVTASGALAHAAKRIATGAFASAGQSCISVQRVIVHDSIAEEFEKALSDAASAIRAGDPFEQGIDVGPLITPEATSRVREWVSEAIAAGGTLLSEVASATDVVQPPTIVRNAPKGTRLRDQEIFGPVLTVLRYNDFSEALELANETVFGLQAGVFTGDVNEMMAAFHGLNFGGVIINDIPTVRLDHQPYGGVRESGNTREGPHYAMEELTELRYLSFRSTQGGTS
jgi:acyl-CoA reductase-like NAD-dependent aldehyde dehydrogenase